ncbi:MAG TPA: YihY/virulence factor BrkB family protein [Acidimicrobiales bacterium]|nr:YihY/virulence factor BrkB family protein [Acidimicrobiales bacterium]
MDAADTRGRQAARSTDIPPRGWKDVLVRTKEEAKADNVPLMAGGVAFFALLALVPGLVALVSLYGLVADPSEVERQVRDLLGAAPQEVRELIRTQLRSVVEGSDTGIGIGALVGLVLALYSASSGMKHMVSAINAAYDESETRKFVRLRLVALALTFGAVAFLAVTFAVVTLLPALLEGTALGGTARTVINVLRWPLLALAMVVGLGVLYRFAPDRDEPRWQWVSSGAVAATGLWVVASIGFSVYAANFGRFNETYGSLGAVIVTMLWLFITAYVVIGGAELNAELERQTARDTTEGRGQPIGRRQAHAADTLGPTAEEVKRGEEDAGDDVRHEVLDLGTEEQAAAGGAEDEAKGSPADDGSRWRSMGTRR